MLEGKILCKRDSPHPSKKTKKEHQQVHEKEDETTKRKAPTNRKGTRRKQSHRLQRAQQY